MARDRLVSEFPPPEQAHSAGRVTDKRLTVQDVLRETAGDKASVPGSVPPLDDRLSRRPSLLSVRQKQAGWQPEDTAALQKAFRPWSASHSRLDTILGLSALGCIFLMIVAVMIHAAVGSSHGSKGYGPRATVVKASTLGVTHASTPVTPSAADLLPQVIGDRWKRLESSTELAPLDQDRSKLAIATYLSGTHIIHAWVDQMPNSASAQACLAQMLKVTKIVHTTNGYQSLVPVQNSFWARPSVVMDVDNAYDPSLGIAGAPGMSAYAHTRSWVSGPDIVTVSSDLVQDRDSFARELLDSSR